MHLYLGIAVASTVDGSRNPGEDLNSDNQITEQRFITQPFMLDNFKAILRCASGQGPSGRDSNVVLGGWYFNGAIVPIAPISCFGPVFEARGASVGRFPGVISLYLCGTFTTTEEGVYSCIVMNSSMMEQTMRVGVYFSGRSESLDMYPITSLLTIFHLSIHSCSNDRRNNIS